MGVMRTFELSNWTWGPNIWQTPSDLLYLSWCIGQTVDPSFLLIITEDKAESVLYFATGIFFHVMDVWKRRELRMTTLLGHVLLSLEFFIRISRNNCQLVWQLSVCDVNKACGGEKYMASVATASTGWFSTRIARFGQFSSVYRVATWYWALCMGLLIKRSPIHGYYSRANPT